MRRTGDFVARAITISETRIPGIGTEVPGPATPPPLRPNDHRCQLAQRSPRCQAGATSRPRNFLSTITRKQRNPIQNRLHLTYSAPEIRASRNACMSASSEDLSPSIMMRMHPQAVAKSVRNAATFPRRPSWIMCTSGLRTFATRTESLADRTSAADISLTHAGITLRTNAKFSASLRVGVTTDTMASGHICAHASLSTNWTRPGLTGSTTPPRQPLRIQTYRNGVECQLEPNSRPQKCNLSGRYLTRTRNLGEYRCLGTIATIQQTCNTRCDSS